MPIETSAATVETKTIHFGIQLKKQKENYETQSNNDQSLIKNFRYETDITGSCDDARSAGFDIF